MTETQSYTGKSSGIIKRDNNVISPSYPRAYPMVMDHGRGTEVWDVDGNRYLDFCAGIAVVSTGHCHPQVVSAIREQTEKFLHISSDFYHEKWVELGEKINELAPFNGGAYSFMSNSGTESVEAALKLARYHTGRTQFVGFHGAFHGRTMGSLAFTGSKNKYRHGYFPLLNGVVHVPFPNEYRQVLVSEPLEDYGETVVRYLRNEILSGILPPQDVAGILVEPIQGEGGYIIPPQGFFPALRNLCDEFGILLIADEVQSGVGRTGRFWAVEHFGVEPDNVCSSKGIASGIPLGITFAKKKIMTWGAGAHGNTYGGNPIACVAALATIDLVESMYMENARQMGAYMIERLEQVQNNHPSIGQVRGKGLMIAVEFIEDHVAKKPAVELSNQIANRTFENGLLVLTCGISSIRFSPPLSVTKAEIDEAIEILETSIAACEREKLEIVA